MAKEISLASNNAAVLAVRAGSDAAGFGALAEFLDQLARKTIHASDAINKQAMVISKLTSTVVKTQTAQQHFERAFDKGEGAEYLDSLQTKYSDIKNEVTNETEHIESLVRHLVRELEDLKQELEVGKVLASMSLVEASQADKAYTNQLSDNANNISSAINRIESNVGRALKLIATGRSRGAKI
ncbi:hypothetical protein PN836_006945 [Ningiella sp. W23]|uniref:hypothetical protein n=1 Tax=Ningiella sp. W23 TaxID=3023715 RepID=UPI00375689BA